MSNTSLHRLRQRAIAAMVALVLSPLAAATASERVQLSGLQSADGHDRFIVKYREDSRQFSDRAALRSALDTAAKEIGRAHV